MATADLYIELLKRTLANEIYWEYESLLIPPASPLKKKLFFAFDRLLRPLGIRLARGTQCDREKLRSGGVWPGMAMTMIGLKRLDNIRHCVETVLRENIPGDLMETGVWRGGASIFMKGILKAYNDERRKLWVVDSFQGLPPPDADKYPADKDAKFHTFSELAISLESVCDHFQRFECLDDRVIFLKGWFSETLPSAAVDNLAVLRLDGDMYGSTMDVLRNMYPKLTSGGFLIVDDYALEPCRKAVTDYRQEIRSDERIEQIDQDAAFWRKA